MAINATKDPSESKGPIERTARIKVLRYVFFVLYVPLSIFRGVGQHPGLGPRIHGAPGAAGAARRAGEPGQTLSSTSQSLRCRISQNLTEA